MKKSNYIILGLVGFCFITLYTVRYTRIDAGNVGIVVNLYGNEKGVSDITQTTGAVWYNGFTTRVIEFPTYIQNAVYTLPEDLRYEENEEFRVTTKDGLVVGFDVSINYYVPSDKVVFIYQKYRKDLNELSKTVIRNYLRESFNTSASNYTASDLYEKRTEFQRESEMRIKSILEKDGFVIDQVVLLNELRLPKSVVDNIEQKVSATQQALRKQEELAQSKADAQKKIEEARGNAEALKLKAEAERYAYDQRSRALNPLLIKQMFVEKWDGKLPVYGQLPTLFMDVLK